MTEESKIAMRASKATNIIMSLCELYNISLQKATDIYYRSVTSEMIDDGVADLQCRSDRYLATLVWEEYQETITQNSNLSNYLN